MNVEPKYTMTFKEWANNNPLPAIFSEIAGFSDLFRAKFIDREIGWKDDEIFADKLGAKALEVIPIYKQRLTAYEAAIAAAPNAKKTITEEIMGGYSDTFEAGAQKQKVTELPLNYSAGIGNPSGVTDNDAYTNESEREESRSLTREESGETTLEVYAIIEKLQGEIYNIKRLLLREFESLFFGVF